MKKHSKKPLHNLTQQWSHNDEKTFQQVLFTFKPINGVITMKKPSSQFNPKKDPL